MVSTATHEWDPADPFELAPGVWWVGAVLAGDRFQCHSYLIDAGDQSVLIDPGSPITVEETLDKVARIVPLESVRSVVCLHSDPDVAGCLAQLDGRLTHPDVRLVSEWRSATMLRHYGSSLPIQRVEELGWVLDLGGGRTLRFLLTPYLHYPGAMVAFDSANRVLFSSDLFGGFSDGSELAATDAESCFEAMRLFHEHYMPSREILANGLARIRRAFRPIELVAPQHGVMIPGPMVDDVFELLSRLECGLFLMAHDDEDVAELLRYSVTLRRVQALASESAGLLELMEHVERLLTELTGVRSASLRLEQDDGTPLRIGEGLPRGAGSADLQSFALPGGAPRASLEVDVAPGAQLSAELSSTLEQVATTLRGALDRHMELRRHQVEQDRLRAQAVVDQLTSLYNRHALDGVDVDEPHAVLLIDVDRFKVVNDLHGHIVGDEVLRRLASSVVSMVRDGDLVVRYGGDELLGLVSTDSRALASEVAQRIRARAAELPLDDLGPGLGVTVSVGVAMHRKGMPLSLAIADADHAMYAAKRAGRDRVRLHWLEGDLPAPGRVEVGQPASPGASGPVEGLR
jgi:diguanylate cyclase (GGDEF)-like protein